ncbi:MAG: peptide/nickel transport system permease protein [Pseudonocardiales bacterium]|nr:peptide/nickel transport system permease protein [Pseudonocardiales bacterium]
MIALIAKRVVAAFVILVALTAALFGLQRISKSDPVHTMLGPGASPQAIATERHKLGLDKPLLTQFWNYLTGVLHGDFGVSYRTRRPVSSDLGTFLPATLELAVFGLLLALVLAGLLAVATTLRWPGAGIFRFILLVGGSTPAFFLAIGGIIVFYKYLGVLPATGRASGTAPDGGPTHLLTVDALLHGNVGLFGDALKHLLLPGLAVAIGPAVSIGRVLRSSLLTTVEQDYTRTARAKGLREIRVLGKHVLRNSAGPALSMTGLQVGLMFAGVLVVESIFAWPGLGQYTAQSLPVDDFPAIAGVTLLLGVGYVLINTIVDVLQSVADPRIDV